ncbi:hypothetical protein V5O48_013161 [Marasmius crinis-equi]|uniref:Uncharacterized protein n=1 Tax=Marasmius crinis-equi TaxID=585013 RepID=A0ABR3F0U9_9AGAR
MKLAPLAGIAFLAVAAFGQHAEIGSPKPGAQITAGTSFTVEVDRPDTLTGSQEVAIVIGYQSCANSACRPPADGIQGVLYSGPFNPQFGPSGDGLPPHQNFDVTIPASTPKGTAQLTLYHFSLVAASMAPLFESSAVNITLV